MQKILIVGRSSDLSSDAEERRWKLRIRAENGVERTVFLICFADGSKYALDSICPHSGGDLSVGDIEDVGVGCRRSVICPYHAYDFDLETGESQEHREFFVQTFHVKEDENGWLSLNVNGDLIELERVQRVKRKPAERMQISKEPQDLCEWAVLILNTPDPRLKVQRTFNAFHWWSETSEKRVGSASPPEMPLRDESLVFVKPERAGRRGKGGNLKSRIAILHALANIEQWAIDLAWDIIARFKSFEFQTEQDCVEFCSDFVKVANDEAVHFTLLVERLEALGSHFGDLPVHDGLWESATTTSGDLMERLAIVHMVHEARGLDVNPTTIQNFVRAGDEESVKSLQKIHADEVTHVAAGHKWFNYCCQVRAIEDRIPHFHSTCRRLFRGKLKPPFNSKDRAEAGLSEDWYLDLQY